ncbi:hypothetical protein BDP27DRAFT_1340247 [Rhodocollybia butyracea]|uniref:Uncharacterized protein n=1 Tax=Rhodocollybia butyracea TaxID=206335 RepID=A0A9P5PC73_9AGAR|nr:hypothetical protein BDP27DRAFT_1340247 [Rhodocollybia butyracea]
MRSKQASSTHTPAQTMPSTKETPPKEAGSASSGEMQQKKKKGRPAWLRFPVKQHRKRTSESLDLRSAALFQRPAPSNTWNVSESVLKAILSSAQLVPSQYVGTLSSIALGIWNAVSEAKDNKDDLRQLACLIVSLVHSAVLTYNQVYQHSYSYLSPSNSDDGSSVSTLNKHLEELITTLRDIQSFITNLMRRPLLQRIISSKSDSKMVKDYQKNMRHALDVFSLQSTITLRGSLTKIECQQEALLHSWQESTHSTITSVDASRDDSDSAVKRIERRGFFFRSVCMFGESSISNNTGLLLQSQIPGQILTDARRSNAMLPLQHLLLHALFPRSLRYQPHTILPLLLPLSCFFFVFTSRSTLVLICRSLWGATFSNTLPIPKALSSGVFCLCLLQLIFNLSVLRMLWPVS